MEDEDGVERVRLGDGRAFSPTIRGEHKGETSSEGGGGEGEPCGGCVAPTDRQKGERTRPLSGMIGG